MPLQIFAHRGHHTDHPENTVGAFDAATAIGAHGIELDLHLSRDGRPVVLHDAAVDRTTDGSGAVADMTLAEIGALRSSDQNVQGEKVPTFAETIECLRGRARMLVEFKGGGLAEQAVRQIEAAGVEGQCTLSSFDEDSLLEGRRLNPSIETAYFLVEPKEFDAAEAYRIGLVQEVVPAGTQLDRAIEIAEVICTNAPLAVQATKESSARYVREGEEACVAALGPTQARLASTADAAEGVAAFRERRTGNFTGT